MSIAKRIEEAITKMDAGDFEGALIPTSIAVDATAIQEYPNTRNSTAYKNFIHENFEIISKVSSGGTVTIGNLKLKYNHPDITPDQDGMCSIEQILYHVVRCGLLHTASLPSNLKFINKGMIKVDTNSVILPTGFIYGLLAAVVVSPFNKHQRLSSDSVFKIREYIIPLNELWGNKEKLVELYSAQFDNKPEPQHKETIIDASQSLRNEKILSHTNYVIKKVDNAEYKNFLQKTANEVAKLINAKTNAWFRQQIKMLCTMAEKYGQMLDKYGKPAKENYESKEEIQKANKEAEEAKKELKKIQSEWPEIYRKHGESEITRKLRDKYEELLDKSEASVASKAHRNGPPEGNYRWNNYWDNEYIRCPWDTFWPVFWRPPELINPLWWFPYSCGNPIRFPNDSERHMRDCVILAVIHDEYLKEQDPASRFIYLSQPYEGTYFERDRFFYSLWSDLRNEEKNKYLIQRAFQHITNDLKKINESSFLNQILFNLPRALIKHFPYIGPFLYDVIYGKFDSRPRQKEITDQTEVQLMARVIRNEIIKYLRPSWLRSKLLITELSKSFPKHSVVDELHRMKEDGLVRWDSESLEDNPRVSLTKTKS